MLSVISERRVSGHFAPWLDRFKSVCSNMHIDYSSSFQPLPSQNWLAEVVNLARVMRSNFWLE